MRDAASCPECGNGPCTGGGTTGEGPCPKQAAAMTAARDFSDPTKRVEATTTPEGAKGWADRAGSAQVPAGGHGLNVAPDASPEGVRAETRPREDRAGGEPSNAPTAGNAASISWMKVSLIGMPGTECGRRLLDGAETAIAEDFKAEFGACEEPGRWMAGMLFLCDEHAAVVAREFGDDFEEIKDAICDLHGWDRSRL